MFRINRLWPCSILAALVVGCDEPAEMEIDANSTTNPPYYDRQIPDDAVIHDGEGTQSVSEQTANTEDDSTGPPQEESLEGAYDLEDFRGQMVLLVFAGSPDVPAYERLKVSWKTTPQKDDVVLVESLLRGASPEATKTLSEGESQVMRSRLGLQPSQFKAVLFGPDGQVVEEWEETVRFEDVLEAMNTGDDVPPGTDEAE